MKKTGSMPAFFICFIANLSLSKQSGELFGNGISSSVQVRHDLSAVLIAGKNSGFIIT